MNALILEPDPLMREQLIEVLSWFRRVTSISLAETAEQVAQLSRKYPCELVLVGAVDDQEQVLRELRRTLPARFAAYRPLTAGCIDALTAAGADVVFDARLSIWKVGLVLRPLFWSDQEKILFRPIFPADHDAALPPRESAAQRTSLSTL